jgi:uncharacterized protein YjiK
MQWSSSPLLVTSLLLGLPVPQTSATLRCDVTRKPVSRWGLPSALAEVSGLAVGREGHLLAHGDERGLVLELDQNTGRLLGRVHLKGKPRDDFEGIAASGRSVALMTSAGRLYLFDLAQDSGEVAFRRVDTGLGQSCEMEGLAWDTRQGQLLIPCKNGRTAATRAGLTVLRWSLGRSAPAAPLQVPAATLSRAVGTPRVNLTAVDLDPVNGNLMLLASRPAVLITLTPDGRIVGVARLRSDIHPRPEGLAVTRDAVYIGDEGMGQRGTIARYACAGGG